MKAKKKNWCLHHYRIITHCKADFLPGNLWHWQQPQSYKTKNLWLQPLTVFGFSNHSRCCH